jgi:hypothetical protein
LFKTGEKLETPIESLSAEIRLFEESLKENKKGLAEFLVIGLIRLEIEIVKLELELKNLLK